MKNVRTRFAPSPTGYLHIGGLRSALYAYAWAKKNKGTFILRIEDTDQARFVEGAIKQIIESLHWAGISPDEGVIGENEQKGDHGPYIQSERLDLYKKYAQGLLDAQKAYKCFCTSERLEEMRAVQRAAKQIPKYDRHCLNNQDQEGEYVIRFFVPDGNDVSWEDDVFKTMTFDRNQVDDFVMIKADGFPTYNFANVVDDHLMEITHVMRGQEFLPSTPKHLLLYEAFGWEKPEMAHLPWILGKNKQKLSKREGDVAVDDYIKKGILPEAMINYLALLGWSPKDDTEIFDLDEFIKKFELVDIQKAGAVFDLEKLAWVNGQYIRSLSEEELLERAKDFVNDLSNERVQKAILLEQDRLKQLDELPEKIAPFIADKLEYDAKLLVWKKMDPKDLPQTLQAAHDALEKLSDSEFNQENIQSSLRKVVEDLNTGVGDVFWPVRVALTGLENSPGPQEVAEVLGKEESIKRIKRALEMSSMV